VNLVPRRWRQSRNRDGKNVFDDDDDEEEDLRSDTSTSRQQNSDFMEPIKMTPTQDDEDEEDEEEVFEDAYQYERDVHFAATTSERRRKIHKRNRKLVDSYLKKIGEMNSGGGGGSNNGSKNKNKKQQELTLNCDGVTYIPYKKFFVVIEVPRGRPSEPDPWGA